MKHTNWIAVVVCLCVLIAVPGRAFGQTDPGPRSGTPGAGSFFPLLSGVEQALFSQGLQTFQEVDSVSGNLPGEPDAGLGPTFNGNSCAMCHAEPSAGGSSPGLNSPQHAVPNPQVALANLDGANNQVPSFITANGPVREARFIRDGGVHALYTIQGRSDAAGCTLAQPNFARELRGGDVIFRIPTPVFGLGLVEATSDSTLRANLAANQSQKSALGIQGTFNTSGNDGTITRFGWKAQNKSLLMFAGEAYNVEQGVSNDLFPNERAIVPGCVFNGGPEDAMGSNSAQPMADIMNFALFARFSAPPTPGPSTSSTQNGAQLFVSVGCAFCHSPSLTTDSSRYPGMSNFTYHPFSDFAIHHMGQGLADSITQGAAGGDQFRTAPLWGVGQRLFFMHDGRTSDLMQAIAAHQSRGSEANGVIGRFHQLNSSQAQDLLNFLRSL